MDEQRVLDASFQYAPRQVLVIGRARPDVVEIEPAISAQISLRVLLQPRAQSLLNIPIGRINRDVSHLVTVLFQKRARLVTPFHGVTLFEHREPEESGEARIALDQLFAV